jgi:DNA-binding SARP family transcriptional activator/tetratricopeptide (TPR) repeat protein
VIQLQTFGRVRLAGENPGDEAGPATAQPKRLAVLAYLALMSSRGPVRRDTLLALFWPELGGDEARRALRQSLHYLRRVLADDVLLGAGEELSVNGERLRCDAAEFERLVAGGDPTRALSLYQGDFLAGFHVPDVSSEFEEWVDRTRARLRRQAATAAWAGADAAEAAGRVNEAIELGRRGCELEPDQEGWCRRLMLLQDRLGDRAGALRTYDELATRLRRDFEAEPSAETAALARKLRAARTAEEITGPGVPAAAPPTASPASEPVSPGATPAHASTSLPRRKGLPIALGATLVLGVAFAAFQLAAERREEPSLIDAGAIAPRDRLLIADFVDTGGDTALGIAITDAFRVDLAQSPNVRVMTPRQVRGALERMERSADLAINDSLARELAMREGVKAFVVGRISNIAGRWAVTVELVGAESAEVLAAVRETAEDSTGLIGAVDRASETLRHRLGESLRDLRSFPPLAQEVTASLPALRKYTEAMRLSYASERKEALKLLREAVALDSTFASAHSALSHLYDSLDEPGRAQEALSRAMAHLDRLPFQDRQFLIGSDAQGRGDYGRAIQAYTDFLARYPHYAPAINNLALAYRDARNLPVAESLWARSIEVDSGIVQLYFGLHSAQLLAGKFADSRRTLDLIGRRSPGNPVLLLTEVQDAAAQGDWESAERRAEANIAAKQGDTLNLVDAFEQMAGIVMTQGRLAEAERHWRTQLVLAAAAGSWGRRLYGAQMLGWLRLRFRNDSAGAIAVVDSALRRMPLDSMLPGDRPYQELARFFAAAGDLRRSRAMLAVGSCYDAPETRNQRAERLWTEGNVLLAEGRSREAEPLLREATEISSCTLCALPDLARAREAQGNAAGAIEVYERYLATPWLFRYEVDAYELAPALQRLAALYESRGDRTRASRTRTRLLALWRRADAELQPVLADVRTRLTAPEQ